MTAFVEQSSGLWITLGIYWVFPVASDKGERFREEPWHARGSEFHFLLRTKGEPFQECDVW